MWVRARKIVARVLGTSTEEPPAVPAPEPDGSAWDPVLAALGDDEAREREAHREAVEWLARRVKESPGRCWMPQDG